MLPDSQPSQAEWLPRQMRHWVSEIKHIILFFRNRGTFRKKKKKEPVLLECSAHCVQFLLAPEASNLRARCRVRSQKQAQLFLSLCSFLGVGQRGEGGWGWGQERRLRCWLFKGPAADHWSADVIVTSPHPTKT